VAKQLAGTGWLRLGRRLLLLLLLRSERKGFQSQLLVQQQHWKWVPQKQPRTAACACLLMSLLQA
jgi:hypothetical protein